MRFQLHTPSQPRLSLHRLSLPFASAIQRASCHCFGLVRGAIGDCCIGVSMKARMDEGGCHKETHLHNSSEHKNDWLEERVALHCAMSRMDEGGRKELLGARSILSRRGSVPCQN